VVGGVRGVEGTAEEEGGDKVEFEGDAGRRRRGVGAGREDQPRQGGEHAHVDEGQEGQPARVDAGQPGRLLIAARIANGLTQQELAERVGVSAAQVSRDERNEYHGIMVERAQLILDCLGERLTTRLDEKALALVV